MNFSGPSFGEYYHRNKLLSDRIEMLASLLDDGNMDETNISKVTQSNYYFAMTNIYKISTAMFMRGRSFILPLPMMYDLSKKKTNFFNDKEALEYVKLYENSICNKIITITKTKKKK